MINRWTRSKRLKKIANYIPDDVRVADIGADHAFLLIHLASEGRLKKGIIGEVNQGPYENALSNVKRFGFQQLIDVRLGDGLSILQPNEIDVIVLAGMGGSLIMNILNTGIEKLASVQKLVLQPNIGSRPLRRWLDDHGWRLMMEDIVDDEGILYEILVACPGDDLTLYQDEQLDEEMLYEIGPILWKDQHPLLRKKLQIDLEKKQKVVNGLKRGKSIEAKQKLAIELRRMRKLERVIRWL